MNKYFKLAFNVFKDIEKQSDSAEIGTKLGDLASKGEVRASTSDIWDKER